MAQAPLHLFAIASAAWPSTRGTGARLVGYDGFPWIDRGVEGEAQIRFDWILKARLAADPRDADRVAHTVLQWLDTLRPIEQIEAGLTWVARWHWLWNAGALEDGESSDERVTHLVFAVDEDMTALLERSLWSAAADDLSDETLERMLCWSASGLFDRSHLWPRDVVVRQVRRALCSRQPTAGIVSGLALLLEAELRDTSRRRIEPENQSRAIGMLLHAIGPADLALSRQAVPNDEPRAWARVVLDPTTWAPGGSWRVVLRQLAGHGLLDEPEVAAALAGARASLLSRLGSQNAGEVHELLAALKAAITRPN
jgi:hypothetical protein